MIEVSWPGQPFLDRTIEKGDVLLASGQVRFFHGRQLQPREFINLGDDETATSGRVLSVEVTEVNPLLDTANQTAQLAVELILSALGKKIV